MKTATVLVLLPLASFALHGCGDPGELAETDLLAEEREAASEPLSAGSWTPWISEETPPALCSGDTAVSGIAVSGSFSDNVSLFCHNGPVVDYSTSYWTEWFSEESPARRKCSSGNFVVTGLQCSGRYCDNMRFECTKMLSPGLSSTRVQNYVSTAFGDAKSFTGSGVVFVGLGCIFGRFCEAIGYEYAPLQ